MGDGRAGAVIDPREQMTFDGWAHLVHQAVGATTPPCKEAKQSMRDYIALRLQRLAYYMVPKDSWGPTVGPLSVSRIDYDPPRLRAEASP
jgi:hypothetical protein